MADIFLSYAREDLQRVLPLVRALEERGWSVWWDRTIPPGRRFAKVIEEALEAARCVVVVWSTASVDSDWVEIEASEGRQRDILVPVRIDDVRIPFQFRGIQTANLSDWQDLEPHEEFAKLVSALVELLGAPPRQTAQASNSTPATPQDRGDDLSVINGLGMEFVPIPAGEFLMGTAAEEVDSIARRYHLQREWVEREVPCHEVRISQPFDLGKYPVTQAQWEAVMGNNPSAFTGDPTRPVEKVSWEDVQRFIEQLNARDRTAGETYRLPTEAEWEYAARAGTTTAYSFGDDPAQLGAYAWYDENSGNTTHPVGQKQPNPWGLYDMHGNVWEWVQDWYDEAYYSQSPTTDPQGPDTGSRRVFRGGGWYDGAGICRSAYRRYAEPGFRDDDLGFRLLRQVR
jgi:formylglycine-generating enzyme required for sulfatase activity